MYSVFLAKYFKTLSGDLDRQWLELFKSGYNENENEKSKVYICDTKSWIDFKKIISSKTTTYSLNEKYIKMAKIWWVFVLNVLIYVDKFITGQILKRTYFSFGKAYNYIYLKNQ